MSVTINVDRRLGADGSVVDREARIVVEGDRIREIVEYSPGDPTPADIQAKGYTALPGMIDAHLHLAMHNCRTFGNYRVGQYILPRPAQSLYTLFHAQLCLEMGFTTVRDMGLGRPDGLLTAEMCAIRDAIKIGIFAGPRILVGGWAIMTGAHLDRILPRHIERDRASSADGPYGLRRIVRDHVRTGVDFIKTCASGGFDSEGVDSEIINHTQEELNAIGDEARALRKPLAVHCFTPLSQRMAITAGTNTIEHCVFADDETIDEIKARELPVVPTLAHRSDVAIDVRRTMGTPASVLDGMKRLQPHCYETFQRMYQAGVRLVMGTDTGYDPPFGDNALELELYVELGMPAREAILTATHNAADALGLGRELGRIDVGKRADIILVKGNPFDDISLLRHRDNIGLVMRDGTIFIDRLSDRQREIIPPSFDESRKYDN